MHMSDESSTTRPAAARAKPATPAASKRENDMNDVDRPLAARAGGNAPFEAVLERRFGRRALLRATMLAAPVLAAPNLLIAGDAWAGAQGRGRGLDGAADSLGFQPVPGTGADRVTVPDGYVSDVVIRWGDALDPGAGDLDTTQIAEGVLYAEGAADRQARRFGYNCDAAHYFALDGGADHGLVCVNHEFTNDELLFPGYPEFFPPPQEVLAFYDALTPDQRREAVATMQNCHGISVVELRQGLGGAWGYRADSPYNRRITAKTVFAISGPAAGDDLLKVQLPANIGQDGTRVYGTLNNCAGGATPWGTYLSAEENFDQYFANFDDEPASNPLATNDPKAFAALARIGFPGGPSIRRWDEFGDASDKRFDLSAEPHEALRFGWIVEVDPFDPASTPKKRTALGRFKHECAATAGTRDGRLAVYSGDDARLEYVYKFVSDGKVAGDRARDADVLDHGTLYVARFDASGRGEWLPLVHGRNGLTSANGFDSQADVLINARGAADILGATPMDRPEDIEPKDGRVYIAMTKNGDLPPDPDARDVDNVDTANPRLVNSSGHVVELLEDGDDHGATTFRWEIFLLCGDPAAGRFIGNKGQLRQDLNMIAKDHIDGLQDSTTYFGGYGVPAEISPIGAPDNLASDDAGNLWIVTDGSQPNGGNDGCFAVPMAGAARGKLRRFMEGPVDCEVCGCEFTPDFKALFLNIQHPGDGGPLTAPTSTWPDAELASPPVDANGNVQPRPSLVAVRRADGGKIGS